tara:strand:+ start:2468 stop:3883 length:1416 start_codon:yes stop_codon:yes gene_type:complete
MASQETYNTIGNAAAAALAWAGPAEAAEAAKKQKERKLAEIESTIASAAENKKQLMDERDSRTPSYLYKQPEDAVMNHERQMRVFDIYMMVYKGEAYTSKEHEGWVRDCLRLHPELCRTTLIYHHEDESWRRPDDNRPCSWIYGMDDKFRANLLYPIPVYWGGSRDDLFSWHAVRGLGYGMREATKMSDEIRDTVRYAIVGAVKVKAYGVLPERDAFVIHTEGVNLESSDTAAFQAIVGRKSPSGSIVYMRSKEDMISLYYNRHRAMLKLIIEAAMSEVDCAAGESAFIQAPMIGAGCFLRGIRETNLNVNDFLMQQVLALISVLNSAPHKYNFTFKLCIFNTEEFSNDIMKEYHEIQKMFSDSSSSEDASLPRFMLGTNQSGGNVLADVPYGNPKQKVFVVNAGDLRSCIGNGMSHENSVEGFIVANAKGYNPQWQNTSFLHNPYFNPDIFDPVRAAMGGRQVWKGTMKW